MLEMKKPTLKLEHLIDQINYDLAIDNGKYGYKYRIAKFDDGLRLPVKVVGKDLEVLNQTDALDLLRQRAKNLSDHLSEYYKGCHLASLTHSNAVTVFNTLKLSKDLVIKEPIKTFAFKSDDSYTFCRIPFDLNTENLSTPTWDKFLANFTNNKAMQMWIGSLFVLDSDRSQYLWIYGSGLNGKSTFATIISTVLGKFSRIEQVPSKEDKYWTFGLIGSRLIVIDDCTQYGFVKTSVFKTATGIGKCRVEQKFGDARNADLTCKFLFTSNDKPMVSDEIADQRRLIFCSALNKEKFTRDPVFDKNLADELPNFISNCVLLFKANCAGGKEIPVDQTEALELGNVFNEEIESWIERHFEYDDHSFVEVSKFRAELDKTKLNDRRVYRFLEKQGTERIVKNLGGKYVKVLKGLKQKVFSTSFSI